jgi:hypothetical protein
MKLKIRNYKKEDYDRWGNSHPYKMYIYVYLLPQTTFLHNILLINDTINISKRIVSMFSRVLFHIPEYLNVKFIMLFILKITLGFVSYSTMGLWKIGLQLTGMILLWRIRYYGLTQHIVISCLVYLSNSFSSCPASYDLLDVFGTSAKRNKSNKRSTKRRPPFLLSLKLAQPLSLKAYKSKVSTCHRERR